MINIITNKYPNLLREFYDYYKDNNSTSFNNFIKLSLLHQVGVFNDFFIKKYNIGFHYDAYTYVLYYYNAELVKDKIIDKYKKEGIFTHTIISRYDLPFVSLEESIKRVMIKLLDYISNDF